MHDFLNFAANHEGLFTIAGLFIETYPLILLLRIHEQMLPANENYLQDDGGLSLAAGIVKYCGWPVAISVYGGIALGIGLMIFPAIAGFLATAKV